jgi:hypothetical protein
MALTCFGLRLTASGSQDADLGSTRWCLTCKESSRNSVATMLEPEQVLISVWRQTLVDGANYVQINGEKYAVRETLKQRLKQVDFRFDGHELRGLEQNPDTKSRWAKMAREGKKVMQFLDGGRYVAVVVDGKMKTYG